jgi:periplasmic copper chaperone A
MLHFIPRTRTGRVGFTFAAAAALTLGSATAAFAHISAVPGSAVAGSSSRIDFRVPHGCDGADTYEIEMSIPSSVTVVKPKFEAGWIIRMEKEKVTNNGVTTERVAKVSWTGGPVPDDMFEDFALRIGVPNTPNTTIYFPIIQRCRNAKPVLWTEIPKAGEAEPAHPAPSLKITPKA